MKTLTLTILTTLLVFIATATSPPPSFALTVPLTVQEALPAGVTGMARTAAPVTVGIPLAEDSDIKNVNQLGLSGVTVGQFRPLAWWPNGNIRWVLADFQTDLTAGQVKSTVGLTDGSGNFGGSNLATDGATISVNTGAATFTIKKANFNVFDTVTVGGAALVTTGNAGRVSAVGSDDAVYTSVNDTSSTAVIEENGPLRCVIKATGSLMSAGSARLMDYTLRLHFYKGSSRVKSFVTLRNATQSRNFSIAFKSAEVIVPITLGATPTVTFARKNDTVTAPLTGTANLQQGHSSYATYPTIEKDLYNWTPPVPGTGPAGGTFTYDTAYNGLSAQIGATSYNSFGTLADWTQGFATLEDATNKGVTVAMRYMGGYWPASFEIKDTGDVSIELYGKWTNKSNKLEWGKHDTREVIWDFHTTSVPVNSALYQLQYPVIAKANFSQYATSKAFYGQSEITTEDEQNSAYALIGKTGMALTNPAFTSIYRAWAWGGGGGDNQTDISLDHLFNFLRTGNAGWYLIGEHRGNFIASSGVKHSDNFSTTLVVANTAADPIPTYNGVSGKFMGSDADEHSHVMVIPFLYYLTGNEMLKEDMLDYGEYLWRLNVKYPYSLPKTSYFRVWNRHLKNIALSHEFEYLTHTTPLSGTGTGTADTFSGFGTTNITYSKLVTVTLDYLLDSRDLPGVGTTNVSTKGRNLDRGYVYWDSTLSPGGGVRITHSFFHTQIHFDTMWQILRIINDTGITYTRRTELEDYMTGLSRFFYDEYITYSSTATNKYIFNYDYTLDSAPSAGTTVSDSARAAVWAFQQTGDATYLTKGLWTSWASNQSGYTPGIQAEPQDQQLLWTILNQSSISTWQNLPITKTDNGGGSYTLSWTVPAGSQKYQIKYSSKPIVEWLGFDKVTRKYQYDPASYTAFFAATNITNNPAPTAAGSTQSITLTGLPAAQNFAVKVLTASGTVTAPSTPARPTMPRSLRLVP